MRGAIVPVVLASACSQGPSFIVLPESAATGAIVVAVEDARGVRYRAAERPGPIELEVAESALENVHLAIFVEPLSALGLQPGDVASSSDPGARALPMPADVFRLESGAWVRSALGEALARLRIPEDPARRAQCAWSAPVQIDLGGDYLDTTVALPDGRVLVKHTDGFELLARDRPPAPVTISSTIALRLLFADDRGIWFGDLDGGLRLGLLGGPAEAPVITLHLETVFPPGRSIRGLASAGAPGRYLVSRLGAGLAVYDGVELHPPVTPISTLGLRSATGGGRTFAVVGYEVFEVVDRTLVLRHTSDGRIHNLHWTEEDGWILVREAGPNEPSALLGFDPDNSTAEVVFSLRNQGSAFGSTQTARGITYATEFGDGTGTIGAVYHYVPGLGVCGEAIARATAGLGALDPLGAGVVAIVRTNPLTALLLDPP